jgi:pSer/pThr/pTyr-binding forkhead associated (FHA) protein
MAAPEAPRAEPKDEVNKAAAAMSEKQMQFAKTQVRGTEPTEPPAAMADVIVSAPAPAAAVSERPLVAPTAASAQIACPSCGNPVPSDFKFCGTCGHKMEGVAASAPPPVKPAVAPAAPVAPPAIKPMTAPVAKATAPMPPATLARRAVLVLINPDGSEGATFALQGEKTVVGRDTGAPFTGDVFLSPLHATFSFKGDKLFVVDNGSLNGVYLKLERQVPVSLEDGSIFRIGQEILKFELLPAPKEVNGVELMGSPNPGYIGRVCVVIGPSTVGDAYAILADGMHIGRERGDVTFPDDGYVSGLHCRIHREGGQVVLTDVGSSNGTFLRIRGEREVRNSELLLMGQQLFSARY